MGGGVTYKYWTRYFGKVKKLEMTKQPGFAKVSPYLNLCG